MALLLRSWARHGDDKQPCPRAPLAGDMNFDYTFTDKELQDVLGYMERGQSGTLDPSLPFFSTATALQFQVRRTRWKGLACAPQPHTGPAILRRSP